MSAWKRLEEVVEGVEEVVEGVIPPAIYEPCMAMQCCKLERKLLGFSVVLIVETLPLKMPRENCSRSMYSVGWCC